MRSTWTRPLSLCCPVWTLMVGLVVGLVQSPMLVRWGVWGILFPPLNHISVFIHCKHMFFSSRLQIYCCTGFLSITGQLHQVNADLLGWWLCERQLPSGGLNGRPEKVRFPSDQWYYQILTNWLIKKLHPKMKIVINHLPWWRSKPVRPSFIFGTQIKMFLIKSESSLTLHRQQCNWHVQGPER